MLLEHDLGVVRDGVIEGRRTVENATKYILMGSSSNFGNMFSMAGAALFLPFLPMLPTQVLLNNLLYDISEVGVPFDNVDAEALQKPAHWDIKFIERFMLVLGPVSSIFDFLTFFALLTLFGAGAAMFQTGWFIESLATQSLVIFVIRTRGAPWRSTPHPLLTGLTVGVVLIGLIIPLTPLGAAFGFQEPPLGFYLFLIGAVAAYLVLVEAVKGPLYRHARTHRSQTEGWRWSKNGNSAPEHDADEEAHAECDAERGERVLPDGILDGFECLAGRVLHALELMVAGTPDLPGQGFQILAQRGKVLGNLLNILAQRLLARHLGVFSGHFVLRRV